MRHMNPALTVKLYEDARLMNLRGAVDKLGASRVNRVATCLRIGVAARFT